MTAHHFVAAAPLILVAGLIGLRRALPMLLIAAAWLAAVLTRSPVAARHFRAMLGLRLSGRRDPAHDAPLAHL